MMLLSRKTIYALVLLVAIAKKGENGSVALKDVAESEDLSVKYLEQIGSLLCKGGIIKSKRGPNGGYRLTNSPEKCMAGEVVRLTEGEIEYDYLDDRKPFAFFCDGLCKAIYDYLDSVSIKDLVEKEKLLDGIYDYSI